MTPDCEPRLDFGSLPYIQAAFQRARARRTPLGGAFDLTYRCNLRCPHCYVGHLTAQARAEAGEMSTRQVNQVLAAAADAGCMFVLFSGGEPLLRNDFVDIYVTARQLGMIVSVFTNATLVSEAQLEVFREYPPRLVEVSVYGGTATVYDQVTGVPGSFVRARQGVDRLLDNGIRVGLKTLVVRDNVEDIGAIRRLARSVGASFRLDVAINPRLNKDRRPVDCRVPPREAVYVELEEPEVGVATDEEAEGGMRILSQMEPSNRQFDCGAGISSFHLDPHGYMHPCIMTPRMRYNVAELGFDAAWASTKAAVDSATWNEPGQCAKCSDRVFCSYCPGGFDLENASPSLPPEYWCELAKHRRLARESTVEEVAGASGT